jgi:hypothetical protein
MSELARLTGAGTGDIFAIGEVVTKPCILQ